MRFFACWRIKLENRPEKLVVWPWSYNCTACRVSVRFYIMIVQMYDLLIRLYGLLIWFVHMIVQNSMCIRSATYKPLLVFSHCFLFSLSSFFTFRWNRLCEEPMCLFPLSWPVFILDMKPYLQNHNLIMRSTYENTLNNEHLI